MRQNSIGSPENATADVSTLAERLMEVLDALRAVYVDIETCTQQRIDAITSADSAALQSVVAAEASHAARLQELNRQRASVVESITRTAGRPEHGSATSTWVAGLVEEPVRTRLLDASGALRSAIDRVTGDIRTQRLSTDMIATHLRGLLRAVSDELSHAQVYGRNGEVERGRHQVVSMMDVTS